MVGVSWVFRSHSRLFWRELLTRSRRRVLADCFLNARLEILIKKMFLGSRGRSQVSTFWRTRTFDSFPKVEIMSFFQRSQSRRFRKGASSPHNFPTSQLSIYSLTMHTAHEFSALAAGDEEISYCLFLIDGLRDFDLWTVRIRWPLGKRWWRRYGWRHWMNRD